MLQGYKQFIMRGNVVDLAVAVVIGAAFTTVVNSLISNVLNPLIGAIFNTKSLQDIGVFHIGNATVSFGAVLASIVQFLLVTAVIYFAVVLPINAARNRSRRSTPEELQVAPEVELLAEIRDLLAEPRKDPRHLHDASS